MASFFTTEVKSLRRASCPTILRMPQQRGKIVERDLEELRVSIIRNGGLIHQIYLIRLKTLAEAEAYRKYFCDLYGGNPDDFPLQQSSDGCYYPLVSGHRRDKCLSKIPTNLVPKVLLGILTVRNAQNAVPLEAALFQADENLHSRPAAVDEAMSIISIANALRLSVTDGHKITISEIAHRAGRSVETVSNALKYGGLPEYIRTEVVEDNLGYGKAVLLSRLCSEEVDGKLIVPEEVIKGLLKTILLTGMTEPKLKAIVDDLLKHCRDQANGASLILGDELTVSSIFAAEARRLVSKHEHHFSLVIHELTECYRRLGADDELVRSSLGAIHEDPGVSILISKVASCLEQVSVLAKKRRKINDMTAARATRAARSVIKIAGTR